MKLTSALAFALFAAIGSACSSSDSGAPTADTGDAGLDAPLDEGADASADAHDGSDASDGGGDESSDADAALAAPTGLLPTHARSLPFTYGRADVGDAITADERAAATTAYLELLRGTRWLDTVAERAHGFPAGDASGAPDYATWWSGVSVERANGVVTFRHPADGSDNNGLRTAQLLEGACYAKTLWSSPRFETLTRRLVRGLTSWFMAMDRSAGESSFLLARAAYPAPVTSHETPLPLVIDYAAARPGTDAAMAYFIHVAGNPHWPDLWVRNMRSKDDVGHMLRALGEIDTCAGQFSTAEGEAELVELRRRFEGFSRRAQADGYAIATLDRNLDEYVPKDGLAHFIQLFECGALLTLDVTASTGAPLRDCADGNDAAPEGSGLGSSAMQIVRSFHEAAVEQALVHDETNVARKMIAGLGARLDTVMNLVDAGGLPSNFAKTDLVAFLVHAANAGVPLTSREVRWLHARIAEAHDSYLDAAHAREWELFSPTGADGSYSFEPGGAGIDWKDVGLLLGLCAAQYRNATGVAPLDCDAVRAFVP